MNHNAMHGPAASGFEVEVMKTCGMLLRPIEPTHQLVGANESGIAEFFSDKDQARYIAVFKDSEVAKKHAELVERRLPVFSGMYRDNLLLMLVPKGAKSLTSLLPGLERDPQSYMGLFSEIGGLLRRLEESGMGTLDVTSPQFLLNRLAFVPPDHDPRDGHIQLVPPYEFDPDGSAAAVIEQLWLELEVTDRFTRQQTDYLMGAVYNGYTAIG